ncbi:putative ABC transport system permease protein [Chryseolinea serpens]|uniref:Putative ABC transport system permease protein n=1 Tax=Chryseolinea serpens TaxID=947013 RepID=A0A1M5WKW2_9BACT|nr:ABC transporter permease [Chryseolinea serpens]SHH88092.1 putative ABC transport system permease protein [Chryseolinea serpens]
MLKNLIIIAWRNIRKDKTYSAINILGLTIGITCSMFLLMYILDELSFDRYHANAPNIYRVVSNIKEPDNAFTWAVAQQPLAPELRDNYPEVKNAVRFDGFGGKPLFKNGDKSFYEDNIYYADSTAFDMFSYTFIDGDPNTALDQPFSIVLTEKLAIKYFGGTDNAVGQALVNQNNETFKVTGVMKNVPLNSHFIFDALASANTRKENTSWGNFGVYTYIQLPEGYDINKMYASLNKILKEKVDVIFTQYNISIKYELQPIVDIHLHSKIQDEAEGGGDISYIYIFAAVAAFMLIIASINYMNLATARSASRAKEVGIRKVMGSMRPQLIAQFITESVVITLLALATSLILIYALLPLFNELCNKQLPFSYILQAPVLLSLIGIVLVIGIVGGSYPALYLSGFNPVSVLKGKLSAKGGNAIFRKVLVIAQFAISIFMLISTLIVYDQLQYLRNKDLGFTKERVIRMLLPTDDQIQHVAAIEESMRQAKGVVAAASANSSPGFGIGKLLIQVEDNDGKLSERGVDLYNIDYDFVKTLGMTIVQGRDFSRDVPADTTRAVLVNEAMVRRMSWKDPIGKKFVYKGGGPNGTDVEKQVVGVVKDYHQNSLYDVIEPLMINLALKNNFIFIKTEPGDVRQSLAAIEKTWKDLYPNYPFDYQFLDQDFNSQYKSDEKRSQIFTAFSGLTIFIACLGLLGLAAFTTEQRTKEIGVRKVIGASVGGLVLLVAREFFVLVGIGTVLAYPFAWYFTSTWLQSFAYKIELNNEWMTFILSALLAGIITLITVGYHVMRAASANPVKALRDE